MPGRDWDADRQAMRELARRANCPHANAVKVNSALDPDVIYHCWCPDCDPDCRHPLPADFRRRCCGTGPETPHAYNCAGKVAPVPAGPGPVGVSRPAYRPPRRKIAPVLAPVLSLALIGAVLAMVRLVPHGPEPWNAADAAACRTWAAQGARVPEGNGVAYIGDWEDPGHKKLAAAEDALNAGLGGVNPALSGAIQEWEADAESSYVLTPGEYGAALSMRHDRAAITSWCKENKYA